MADGETNKRIRSIANGVSQANEWSERERMRREAHSHSFVSMY